MGLEGGLGEQDLVLEHPKHALGGAFEAPYRLAIGVKGYDTLIISTRLRVMLY